MKMSDGNHPLLHSARLPLPLRRGRRGTDDNETKYCLRGQAAGYQRNHDLPPAACRVRRDCRAPFGRLNSLAMQHDVVRCPAKQAPYHQRTGLSINTAYEAHTWCAETITVDHDLYILSYRFPLAFVCLASFVHLSFAPRCTKAALYMGHNISSCTVGVWVVCLFAGISGVFASVEA
jgi:hypothetical protein